MANDRHMKKKSGKAKTAMIYLLMLISLAAMVVAGYKLWQSREEYAEGDRAYEEIAQMAAHAEDDEKQNEPDMPNEQPQQRIDGDAEPSVYVPRLNVDWDALKSVNDQAAAWLYCPETVIDYPVAAAKDYSYYLNHLIDGKKNKNGALFLDYNNSPDFTDKLSVIYGHHMKSGKMFGTLVNYKKQEYFDEHPYMYLYTPEFNCRFELIYGCVIDADVWQENAFVYDVNLEKLIEYAAANTTFESDVTYSIQDSWLVLSTCSYEFNNARYIVMGKLVRESASG